MDKATVTETIDVNASPDKAWALVGDFGGLVGWFPAVTKSTVEGSGVGALRHLTMPDGNQLTERQQALWIDEAGEREIDAAQALPGRVMPADIARAALFLSSDEAAMITRQTLVVDGGWI